MKSIIRQTNSLVDVGDIIIVKTPLPINPEETEVLGYDVITTDILDFQDWLGAYFAISSVTNDLNISINELNWIILGKDKSGENETFRRLCLNQKEPYWIYFKFEKLASSGQIVNISKVNLKIQDSKNKLELKKKFPFYYQSIFNEDSPNNTETLIWQYNVLKKVSGDSILPHYIEKNRDFSIFWGWICHFFAIIVHFGRKFLNVFSDYLNNLNLIGEFLKQKDYYKDSRVKINEDLKISLWETLHYTPILNTDLIKGYPSYSYSYVFSGYIEIKEKNIIVLKIVGYNKSLQEFLGKSFDLKLGFYYKNHTLAHWKVIHFTEEESLKGKRIKITNNISNKEPICYLGISYPNLSEENLPLFVQIQIEGEGLYFLKEKSKKEIFNIRKDFRKRGTQTSNSLIKKILETKKEDLFYANYLDTNNVGWFLNKNCPLNNSLSNSVQIDALVIQNEFELSNGILINYLEKHFLINQNLSINFNWSNKKISKLYLFCSVYDKDLNEIEDVILGNWKTDENNLVISDFNTKGICLIPKDLEDNKYEVNFPINIITNKEESKFNSDYFIKSFIDQNLYLFTKFNNEKEIYYLKINNLVICASEVSDSNYVIGHYLNKKISSNSNAKVHVIASSNIIQLIYDGNVVATSSYILKKNKCNIVHFQDDSFYYGYVIFRTNIVNDLDIILKNAFDTSFSFDTDNFETKIVLRRLPINLGFLNTKQYYLCCFKNNGSYLDEKAKEIISQKVIPYNGDRLFIDNSFYYDDIKIPLELKEVSFSGGNHSYSQSKNIYIKIKGGIAPFVYEFKKGETIVKNITTFSSSISTFLEFGNYDLKITDSLKNTLNYKLSCSKYSEIDYKLKVYIDRNSQVDVEIFLFGGTETSYTVNYFNEDSIIIPSKNWMELKNFILSSNHDYNIITIQDNGGNFVKRINVNDLFKNIAIDFYDNGEGENLN